MSAKLFDLAIASYGFHGMREARTIDVFGYLETICSRFGVRNADIWTGMLDNLTPGYIAAIRAEMDRRDMSLANLCVDGPHLWMDTPEEREAHRAQMLEYIGVAKTLGAKTIRVDFGGRSEIMPDEAVEYVAARYREYCAICWDEGMRIGPENHWGWDREIGNLLRVKEAVNHPAYGHLLHLGNLADFMEDMRALLPIVMHTHVPANSLLFAKEVFRRLKNAKYAGVLSVEHHSGQLELERVEWQLAYVRGLLAELAREDLSVPAAPNFFHTEVLRAERK